ncbi:uncharacterized protein LOC130356225 [Hyla sarda]|uniref:uncharacterized protein LOC130356225 n=1 Tax=Hyla sarda TaxID=327740 RepID=UPI0024C36903|nr:uncharacterized protein LOC130356225 [Hyla sarda]
MPKWNCYLLLVLAGGQEVRAAPMTSFRLAVILFKPHMKAATRPDLYSPEMAARCMEMAEPTATCEESSKMAPEQRKVATAAAQLFQELADRLHQLSHGAVEDCNLPPFPEDDEWPAALRGESPQTSRPASPVRPSPHHRSWGSWAEITTEESDVSTLAEASSSPDREPLAQMSAPVSARPQSPPLPQWVFGDEPALIQYMRDHVLPQPGKSHPPVPTAEAERARREAEIAGIFEKLRAQHRERYGPKRLPYEVQAEQQRDTKKLEALYIRMLDYPQEGEPPLEHRRATVVKFYKARGFGTLQDCRHRGTILINRRAVQQDYLPRRYHSLERGEIVEYTSQECAR